MKLIRWLLVIAILFALAVPFMEVPTQAQAVPPTTDWWDSNWAYRETISFNSSSLSSTVLNAVIVVSLNSTNFNFAQAQSLGQDIRFVDKYNAVVMAADNISYDSVGQTAILLVQVPRIAAVAGYTDWMYLYWGNPTAPSAFNVSPWDSRYKAVYYMADNTTSTIADKSITGTSNLTKTSANHPSENATGVIGKSQWFNGSSYATTPNPSSFNGTTIGTIEWWAAEDAGTVGYPMSLTLYEGDSAHWAFKIQQINPTPYFDLYNGAGTHIAFHFPATITNSGQWIKYSLTSDGSTLRGYANGQPVALTFTVGSNTGQWFAYCATGSVYGTDTFTLGGTRIDGYGLNGFAGDLDEVRISDTFRSADYILAEYLSETNQFLRFGGIYAYPTVTTQTPTGISITKDGVTSGNLNGTLTDFGNVLGSTNVSFEYGIKPTDVTWTGVGGEDRVYGIAEDSLYAYYVCTGTVVDVSSGRIAKVRKSDNVEVATATSNVTSFLRALLIGTKLWTLSQQHPSHLIRYETTTMTPDLFITQPNLEYGSALATDNGTNIYVPEEGNIASYLWKYNATTGALVNTLLMGSNAHANSIVKIGAYHYVGEDVAAPFNIYKVDYAASPMTSSIIYTSASGEDYCEGLTTDGTNLIAALWGRPAKWLVIDPTTGTRLTTITGALMGVGSDVTYDSATGLTYSAIVSSNPAEVQSFNATSGALGPTWIGASSVNTPYSLHINGTTMRVGMWTVPGKVVTTPTTATYAGVTSISTLTSLATFAKSIPTNLTPGATYYARATGESGAGMSFGADQAFTLTMPTVATFTNTVTSSVATLRGTINNMGVASSAYVRVSYGTTPALGSSTPWQTVTGTGIFFATVTPPSTDTVLYYRADVMVGTVISSGAVVSTDVPSATGGSLMRTVLLVALAAVIVVGVALVGFTLGPVAMLIAAAVGLVGFAIVSALISAL